MSTPKKYALTPEHRARLPEWEARWRAVVLRTEPQTAEEREQVREAMRGLYRAAKLDCLLYTSDAADE